MLHKIRNTCISGVALFYVSLVLDYNNNSQRTGFASYQVSLNKFMQLRDLYMGHSAFYYFLGAFEWIPIPIIKTLFLLSVRLVASWKRQLMASGLKHIFIKCDIQQRQRQAMRLADRLVFMTHQCSSGSVPLVWLFVPALGRCFRVASYNEGDYITVFQPVVKKHKHLYSSGPSPTYKAVIQPIHYCLIVSRMLQSRAAQSRWD